MSGGGAYDRTCWDQNPHPKHEYGNVGGIQSCEGVREPITVADMERAVAQAWNRGHAAALAEPWLSSLVRNYDGQMCDDSPSAKWWHDPRCLRIPDSVRRVAIPWDYDEGGGRQPYCVPGHEYPNLVVPT